MWLNWLTAESLRDPAHGSIDCLGRTGWKPAIRPHTSVRYGPPLDTGSSRSPKETLYVLAR